MTVAHLRYMRKIEGAYGIDILTAVSADSMGCPDAFLVALVVAAHSCHEVAGRCSSQAGRGRQGC
jgi:hypothetical protein